MNRSREGDRRFREGWRELGFYCDFAEERDRWRFVGSRRGLLGFRDLLNDYVRDPAHSESSGDPYGPHGHFGPYMHLTIRTLTPKTASSGPKILDCEIHGRIQDIAKLALLVEKKVSEGIIGDRFVIDEEYSVENQVALEFEIREEGFDPASLDPYLKG